MGKRQSASAALLNFFDFVEEIIGDDAFEESHGGYDKLKGDLVKALRREGIEIREEDLE